ncbi:hypothetical protein MRB53_037078 [Persea americana]|nr:hypothetical protein MRB53_037078 [Persea americana]
MPLPLHPLLLTGSCRCTASRYRVTIPAAADRPRNPVDGPDGPIPLPVVLTDHCNDCRRVTGAIVNYWLSAPQVMVEMCFSPGEYDSGAVSGLPAAVGDGGAKAAVEQGMECKTQTEKEGEKEIWHPFPSVVDPSSTIPGCSLSFSHRDHPDHPLTITRAWCSKCGTPLTYSMRERPGAKPWPEPKMVEIVLGTLDREWLEEEWIMPDMQYWWGVRVPWVGRVSVHGLGRDVLVTDTSNAGSARRPE